MTRPNITVTALVLNRNRGAEGGGVWWTEQAAGVVAYPFYPNTSCTLLLDRPTITRSTQTAITGESMQ